MNDIFEKISKTITETGKVVGEKTKQVSDIARLNARIISAERSISDNYTILGKYYYDSFKDDPATEITEIVNSITASLKSITDMRATILSIKGAVKCQNCGIEVSLENDYCGKCGALLEKPEPDCEEVADCCENSDEIPSTSEEEEKTDEQ